MSVTWSPPRLRRSARRAARCPASMGALPELGRSATGRAWEPGRPGGWLAGRLRSRGSGVADGPPSASSGVPSLPVACSRQELEQKPSSSRGPTWPQGSLRQVPISTKPCTIRLLGCGLAGRTATRAGDPGVGQGGAPGAKRGRTTLRRGGVAQTGATGQTTTSRANAAHPVDSRSPGAADSAEISASLWASGCAAAGRSVAVRDRRRRWSACCGGSLTGSHRLATRLRKTLLTSASDTGCVRRRSAGTIRRLRRRGGRCTGGAARPPRPGGGWRPGR